MLLLSAASTCLPFDSSGSMTTTKTPHTQSLWWIATYNHLATETILPKYSSMSMERVTPSIERINPY